MPGASKVLIEGRWQQSDAVGVFVKTAPRSGEVLGRYPVSSRSELDTALTAGWEAWEKARDVAPEVFAEFLERLADRTLERQDEIADIAHIETALPRSPRLAETEFLRTTDQLRQAAKAARSRVWTQPTLDSEARIGSMYAGMPGVVCVMGPNNFPLAFNCIAGGDFAAAVATGHPVLGKGNPGHPETTRFLALEAFGSVEDVGLPDGFVQLVYRTRHEDGGWLVSDRRVAATAYTGSRTAGLTLKAAAEGTGRLIYLEMSSINPVVVLPSGLKDRAGLVANEIVNSMLLGEGQFCTNPGLILTLDHPDTSLFRAAIKAEVESRTGGTLLDESIKDGLMAARARWEKAGAVLLAAGRSAANTACTYPPTVMEVSGTRFCENSEALTMEAFGNMSLLVTCATLDQLDACIGKLEGNLTGTVYSGPDDSRSYETVVRSLRPLVGRLVNDKVPTGVEVVPSMNHGGPYPSTGHPGFTAVGIPASLRRFAMLQCYDNVSDERLPPELKAANPLGIQRLVDGRWTTDCVSWGLPEKCSPVHTTSSA